MPKMFGFSRRRTKPGRLKVHLGDPLQGTRSPARLPRRPSHSTSDNVVIVSTTSDLSDDGNCQCSASNLNLEKCDLGNARNWVTVPTEGEKPTPRFHHAACVIGSKMVVVGGESGRGLLGDTMILTLDKLAWVSAAPKVYLSPSSPPLKIPACKGHCLVSWGKIVLLIGGRTDPVSDRLSVWSFDVESECWSHVEAKGDIPAARSGHTVSRAGPVLILFGGEDAKGRKLNDLHMLDLKSLMWLPLHYTGTGPCPRSSHVAALYDDRILLVFGGQSKSKILNDLYSLDFETMVWSKIKVKSYHPSSRAGCCGTLCGTKWYITGGGGKKKRHAETLVFDVLKHEWSILVSSPNTSVPTTKGFSLVCVHHQDKTFLIAFGGNKKEALNQVDILFIVKNEHSMSWRSAPDIDALSLENFLSNTKKLDVNAPPCPVNSVARHSLASSAMGQSKSGRKSLSDTSMEPNSISGSVSLRKQFDHEENQFSARKMQRSLVDDKYKDFDDCSIQNDFSTQVMEQRSKQREIAVQVDTAVAISEEATIIANSESSNIDQKEGDTNISSNADYVVPLGTDGRSVLPTNPSDVHNLREVKIASLLQRNALLEEQLLAARVTCEAAEKNLSSVTMSKQDVEKKLNDAVKEVELLKEKLTGMEVAQEEANNLSNIVHSDNVRLEHDVAFLKAVLDDTQKELHSTRGVLAGERARAFQLQVEVFHLKQRFQTMENRAPTPRKPFHM